MEPRTHRKENAPRARRSGARSFARASLLGLAALQTACSSDASDSGSSGASSTASVGVTASSASSGGGGAGGGGGGGTSTGASAGGVGGVGGAGGGGTGGGCDPGNAGVNVDETIPPTLSQTGLYADIASETLAPNVLPFQPAYTLWSDGAVKQRFVSLPTCSTIDTSDMDHWSLPVGTRFWKTFTVDGIRIETRLIERFGPNPEDFFFAAYQWNDDQSDADYVPYGVQNAKGTAHDIPATAHCKTCHAYLPERALGFSAIQLSHDGPGVTIATLSTEGRLTTPAPNGFHVPGDVTARAALGYLHANCGHCHNPDGIQFINPFAMRLLTSQTTVETTSTWLTAVGVPPEKFIHMGITARIAPGSTSASCVSFRMSVRDPTLQMPPLATEVVDDDGLAAVNAWIASLPP